MNNILNQAQALHRQGKLKEAETLYQQVIAAEPEHAEVWHLLSICQAQAQQYQTALDTIAKAIQLQPKTAVFYNSKGNILLGLKKFNLATRAYQEAIHLKPNYAAAYSNLGNSFYQQGKLNSAKRAYDKAIWLDPQFTDAHFNYGILLARLGDNQNAISLLTKTIQQAPHYAKAYGQLAEVYLHEHDLPNAIEAFKKRLTLEPKHVDSIHDLALAFYQNGELDEAIAGFEQVLTLDTQHPECYHNLATAYLTAGDTAKALNYYFRQLEINPMIESYYNIGVLLMNQGRHKEAVQYLAQAAAMDPGYLPVHVNLGALYLKQHRIPDAIKHYQLALEIKPDDSEIQHILSAISQSQAADKAPETYLQHLFDQYATFYDKHLVEHLQYQVPQKLLQAITEERNPDPAQWVILDLGCGTGLCGTLFKPFAKRLIGIDLSPNMIAASRAKAVYDELEVCDVEVALKQYSALDVIVAADVFTYIGKLDALFAKAHAALTPQGLFAFSVERTQVEPYELQQTIRYAHSKRYLTELIQQHQFTILRFDNLILRKQKGQAIEGYLVVLAR